MQARELATSELADELSGPVERLKQGDPGLEVDMDDIKREGRARLAQTTRNP
jgi:hypothetical protein